MAFGYTGLAAVNGEPTDRWIAQQLTGQSFVGDGAAPRHLQAAATQALSRVAGERRLAIVGVGWPSVVSGAWKPEIVRVSNFHNGHEVFARAQPTFHTESWSPDKTHGLWKLVTHGAMPHRGQRRFLEVQIRRLMKKRQPPVLFAKALAQFVRECAKSEPTVGENLVSVYLPANPDKTVIRMVGGAGSVGLAMNTYAGHITTVMLGGVFDTTACFHYWPSDGSEPRVVTPCIAGRDLMIEDLSRLPPTTPPSPPPA